MTKTFVSEAFGRIVDRAVQIHGAAGIAMDLPIAAWYPDARAARIYDGALGGAPHDDRPRAASSSRCRASRRRQADRGPAVSCRSPIAADDIVRTPRRADGQRARRRWSSLEPLRARSSTSTAWASGRARVRADRRGPLQRHVRRAPRRRGVRPAPPAARRRCRPAPTTCCARRACCGAGRPARACPRCSPSCDDESVIGAPFYVMDEGRGRRRSPTEVPPALDTREDRRADGRGARRRARRGPRRRLAGRGPGGLRQADRLPRAPAAPLHRAVGAQQDARDRRGRARRRTGCEANLPESPPATIVHGDFRLGNTMSRADGRPRAVVAIFDWEMATIGDPLADLGYLCTLWTDRDDPDLRDVRAVGASRGRRASRAATSSSPATRSAAGAR